MIIIVSGSVGTGKTTIAKKLAAKLKYQYVDVNELIKKNRLYDKYDKKYGSYIVDTKKLNKFLIKYIKNNKKDVMGMIIDSHMSHFLPKKYVDRCIITTCDISVLSQRLKRRRYSQAKIRENIDAEIVEVCLSEALKRGYRPIIVDTSNKIDINKIVNDLKKSKNYQ